VKLKSLGCRDCLDATDAEEIARMVVLKQDHQLSKKFLKRLTTLEDLCQSSALAELPWLLANDLTQGPAGLVAPQSAWHEEVKHLVGWVRPIAEGPKSTLKLLRVKAEHDLDDNVLTEQRLGC